MLALISDIHSNLEALEAVLADLDGFPIDRIVCLGDVIGYGPDPRACLERVARCDGLLLGNHEHGLLYTAENFNDRARRALEWTRDEINSSEHSREENFRLWGLIDEFLPELVEDQHHYVHGTPRDVTNEYLMPADTLDRAKMSAIFGAQKARISFGGHTHVPGIFVENGPFKHQSECKDKVALPKGRTHVNIGSVGQPRDGDNRASYVLLDGDQLEFRRVPYDFERTMRKIAANPSLDDFLARRLRKGQ